MGFSLPIFGVFVDTYRVIGVQNIATQKIVQILFKSTASAIMVEIATVALLLRNDIVCCVIPRTFTFVGISIVLSLPHFGTSALFAMTYCCVIPLLAFCVSNAVATLVRLNSHPCAREGGPR